MRNVGFALLSIGLMLASSGNTWNGGSMRIVNHRSPSTPIYYQGLSQRKKKINRLRLAHNAKLKRRKSA